MAAAGLEMDGTWTPLDLMAGALNAAGVVVIACDDSKVVTEKKI